MQEWLTEDRLAYFIDETVEQLDLKAFHARYEGAGPTNQPYHPALMVKVLVSGYASGVFSSRRIAQKLHEDVAGTPAQGRRGARAEGLTTATTRRRPSTKDRL